jgi:hypothetical protein
MHITNEATLCVVVRDGIPTEIQALPVGTRALTRSLGTTDDTSSQLRLAMKDMCADDACRAIHTALATAEPDLAKKYGQGFAPITTIRRMPENVVLIAHPDFSQWYASFLSRIDFAPFTVTTRPFRISTPAVLESHSFIMWTAGLKEEVALVEALAFVNSEYKSSLHV